MGKIIRNGIEFCGTSDTADNIIYDNKDSGLVATNTQTAIDELSEKVKSGGNIMYLTQEQYDALPESKESDDVEYRITDAGSMGTAENVGYDNSKSGIAAVNVQDAIDKLDESLSDYSKDIIIARVSTNTITIAQQNFSREYVSYTPPSGYTVLKVIPAYCSQWCGFVTSCNYEPGNKRLNIICANFHIASPIDAIFGCDVILKKN